MDDQNPPPPDPHPQPMSWIFNDDEVFPVLNEPANDDRDAVRMERFKAFIFKAALLSSKNKFLSPKLRSVIEKRIDEFFPDFHTPDHPPYAAMISTAITMLNEDGGSTKEAISQFIRNEHTDLPRAHEYFLKHHLKNLCDEGVLADADERFYILDHGVVTEESPESSCGFSQLAIHFPDLSPISQSDSSGVSSSSSWNSSGSWGSSSSFDRSYVPKRGHQSSQGKKRMSKRGTKGRTTIPGTRINHFRAVKRRGTKGKKVMVETEIQLNAERKMRKRGHKESRCSQVQRSVRKGGKKHKSSSSEAPVVCPDHAAKAIGKKTGKGISFNANIVKLEGDIKLQKKGTDREEVGQYLEGQTSLSKRRRKNKRITKETRIHLDCSVRRQNTVCENTMLGKENQVKSDNLMLKDKAKESAEQTDGKFRHHAVVECRDPVTGKRRTVVDIDLDELQDMVDGEAWDLLERSAEEDYYQADAFETQEQAQADQTEDKKQLIVEGSFVREMNSGELTLLQEFGFDIVKGKLKDMKKTFHPCKKHVGGEKVYPKDRPARGTDRRKSGQCRKYLAAELRQSQGQMSKVISTQDLMLEKLTKATQQQIVVNQKAMMTVEVGFQGSECDNSIRCQAEDVEIGIQNRTPPVTVEMHESEGQREIVVEEELHVIGGVGGCDDDEQEHEILMNIKLGSIGKLKNEAFEDQNKPQRLQSEEQIHQVVKLNGSDTKQQSDPLAEEQGAVVKLTALGHHAKENSYSEGTALLRESISLEFEEENENTSTTNVERESDCLEEEEETFHLCGIHTQQKSEFLSLESSSWTSNFLPQYSQHENEEGMSENTTKQKGDGLGDGNEDIGSQHTQTKPRVSSSQRAELKSQEISSQPQSVQQPQLAEESPHHDFWSWFLKPSHFPC